MEKRISDELLQEFREGKDPANWCFLLYEDLIDARKELEEAKKDSVWREIPENVNRAEVHYVSANDIAWAVPHTRTLPKTPKQELIDKFAEKNALAMKCVNLSKEILEAFAKEYEEITKK